MGAAARSGLSAGELAAVVLELEPLLVGAVVLDATPLAANDDLLLVLRQGSQKHFVLVALGGGRARLGTTTRRFPAAAFAQGPRTAALRAALLGATCTAIEHAPGERRCTMAFAAAAGPLRLVVELFGSRGLWTLLGKDDVVLELSRAVTTQVRTLRNGDRYTAPPPRDGAPGASEPHSSVRFAPPLLPAIDAHFTAADLQSERERLRQRLQTAIDRGIQRATLRIQGLEAQLAAAAHADELRQEADLMLAYAHTVPRGATAMAVPDPAIDGAQRPIALDPSQPVIAQAQARYRRARTLADGAAIAADRHAAATTERERIAALAQLLAQAADKAGADLDAALEAVQTGLRQLLLPGAPKPGPAARSKAASTADAATNYRRFVSIEGYPILVGRNNEQNDRLTMRDARGNDLWLHVGGGRAGSHVIVRLPKGKTASLETLLDAGMLAVHFSKARGEDRIDVLYTWRKHVRKPKGAPAGAVVPSQTRTVTVIRDPARLQRLLAGTPEDDRGNAE